MYRLYGLLLALLYNISAPLIIRLFPTGFYVIFIFIILFFVFCAIEYYILRERSGKPNMLLISLIIQWIFIFIFYMISQSSLLMLYTYLIRLAK